MRILSTAVISMCEEYKKHAANTEEIIHIGVSLIPSCPLRHVV